MQCQQRAGLPNATQGCVRGRKFNPTSACTRNKLCIRTSRCAVRARSASMRGRRDCAQASADRDVRVQHRRGLHQNRELINSADSRMLDRSSPYLTHQRIECKTRTQGPYYGGAVHLSGDILRGWDRQPLLRMRRDDVRRARAACTPLMHGRELERRIRYVVPTIVTRDSWRWVGGLMVFRPSPSQTSCTYGRKWTPLAGPRFVPKSGPRFAGPR